MIKGAARLALIECVYTTFISRVLCVWVIKRSASHCPSDHPSSIFNLRLLRLIFYRPLKFDQEKTYKIPDKDTRSLHIYYCLQQWCPLEKKNSSTVCVDAITELHTIWCGGLWRKNGNKLSGWHLTVVSIFWPAFPSQSKPIGKWHVSKELIAFFLDNR